jgi:hypothetical protein
MKYLKLFESFLEDSKIDKKIFIEISSANSRGVNRNSPDNIKRDAERSWSIGLGAIIDLTQIIDLIGESINTIRNRENRTRLQIIFNGLTNQDFTKIIAGMIDEIKFGKDENGWSDEILNLLGVTKANTLLKKIQRIFYRDISQERINLLRQKEGEFYFLEEFKRLNIEQKISFLEAVKKDPNFIALRNSYIYAVVDESKFEESLDLLVYEMENIKYEK